MKVYVIGRYDPRRASVMPIMEMQFAAGFAHNGCDVTYISLTTIGKKHKKKYTTKKEIIDDYGLVNNFQIKLLPTLIYNHAPHFVSALFQLLWHLVIACKMFWGYIKLPDDGLLVFSQDIYGLLPYILLGKILHLEKIKTVVWLFEFQYVNKTQIGRAHV